ncbi:MAG: hypothetical protein HC772_03815 [Leptolyngbyaceae cyanobacterium CRU_2_3]|nr:hypothetical protein [Leptolyngbyaceae cyanobacterium CRU_2_3]
MAQHSNSSSSSGLGSLLARSFVGLLSITATAIISSVVQRYLTPPAVAPNPPEATSTANPATPANTTSSPGSEAVSESGFIVPLADPTEPVQPDRPLEPEQPIDSFSAESLPVIDQAQGMPNPETEAPQTLDQSSNQPNDGLMLRENLDRSLQDKWNK